MEPLSSAAGGSVGRGVSRWMGAVLGCACVGTLSLSLWTGRQVAAQAAARERVVQDARKSRLIQQSYLMPGCGNEREEENAAIDRLEVVRRTRPRLLVSLLNHREPEVRAACALILANPPTPGSFEAVFRLTNDPQVSVRRIALGAAARYGDPRVVKPLIKALSDRDRQTQWIAASALARQPDPAGRKAAKAWEAREEAARKKAASRS